MILISDGQSTQKSELIAYADTIRTDHGVRLIALGFNATFLDVFNVENTLKEMADEVHTVSLMFFKNSF